MPAFSPWPLSPSPLSPLTLALGDLARLLDTLCLLAWVPALAMAVVMLRVLWLQRITPAPAVSRWLIPVPLPADLPRGPVHPYGAASRRAAYPDAMRRATFTAAGTLPLLLVGTLLIIDVVSRQKPPVPNTLPGKHGGTQVTILDRVEGEKAPGPPPIPNLKNFFSTLIQPVKTRTAPDSTTLDPIDLPSGDGIGGRGAGGSGPGLNGLGEIGEGTGDGGSGPDPEAPPTVNLGLLDEVPRLVSMPAPRYPEMARQAGAEGRVVLELLVGPTGRVEKTRLLASIAMLDDAATAAAREARFTPPRWNNRPVRAWVTLPVRFSLRDCP